MAEIKFSVDDTLADIYAVPENQNKIQQLIELGLRQLAANPDATLSDLTQIPSEIPKPASTRILGLHQNAGEFWMVEDFDAELPDSFWLGADDLST
jgi:hypothetical protein